MSCSAWAPSHVGLTPNATQAQEGEVCVCGCVCGARGDTGLIGSSDAEPRPEHLSGSHTMLGHGHICCIPNSNFCRQLERMRLHNCYVTQDPLSSAVAATGHCRGLLVLHLKLINQSNCIYLRPRFTKNCSEGLRFRKDATPSTRPPPLHPGTRRGKTKKKNRGKEETLTLTL